MGKFGLAFRESDSAKRSQIRSDDHALRQTSRLPEKQFVTSMAFNDAGTLLAKTYYESTQYQDTPAWSTDEHNLKSIGRLSVEYQRVTNAASADQIGISNTERVLICT